MVCPACKHVWFHRDCIQQQALSAGTAYFECPGCRDYILFCEEMSNMGIHIPLRDASWEDEESYEPLLEMHSRCDASQCLYHGGREQAHSRGPWELILCSSCAAEGTHRQCSHLSNTTDMWECNSCAGLATASSANAEFAAPSTASQTAPAPGPSSSSMEPETFGSMPASQAALGTSQSSQLPEHSDLPSVPETEQGTNGTRSPEDRATPEQLRGRRGSRRTAAPRADSDSHTATRRRASGSSRASPAAACRRRRRQRSGRSRTRSRSPLQRRDPSSQSRPRRRHGSRRRPASREQSATRRSTRSATSRSPRASRVPRRRGQARR
ncbi:PHD finger protein 7-like isoform X3 [Gallus gallus]|nr:PHD finger protein 7-like isoform X3 [Gallus gallus]